MLNLKTGVLDYSLIIRDAMKKSLINLINEEIYRYVNNWQKAVVASGLNEKIRTVKSTSLYEKEIGNSVSKRIIYNDLKRFTSSVEDEYQKKVSTWYFSNSNYFEFLYYEGKNRGHYEYHTDYFKEAPRALTLLVGLNNPDEYEGGELFIQNSSKGIKIGCGDVVCFPSNFMYPHSVTPLESGVRKVLVIWTE